MQRMRDAQQQIDLAAESSSARCAPATPMRARADEATADIETRNPERELVARAGTLAICKGVSPRCARVALRKARGSVSAAYGRNPARPRPGSDACAAATASRRTGGQSHSHGRTSRSRGTRIKTRVGDGNLTRMLLATDLLCYRIEHRIGAGVAANRCRFETSAPVASPEASLLSPAIRHRLAAASQKTPCFFPARFRPLSALFAVA